MIKSENMKQNTNIKTKNQADNDGRFDAFVGAPPLNYNEIYLGDSFELCKRVPAKTVDLILEDMPYNTTACEWDVKIDLQLYWETRLRILKPTGVIVLTASQPFTTILASSNLGMLKYEWIWNKVRGANIFNLDNRPLKIHENILVFADKIKTFNPIKVYRTEKSLIRDPINGKGRKIFAPKTKLEHYNSERKDNIVDNTGLKHPVDIIEFSSVDKDSHKIKHPTRKPAGLFEYLIRTYTNENDLVFDGFGGSGTTAIAAYKSNRNFIVIEKENDYYEKAKRRLDNERAQTKLF